MMMLRVVFLVAALLIGSALAVEPITLGTISTIIGFIVSALSLAITAIKFAISYALFILILVGIGIQFIPILREIDIVGILQKWVDESRTCQPLGPGSGNLQVLGNLVQQVRPGGINTANGEQ